MKELKELAERELECIQSASLTDGDETVGWSIEAIAISLYRIANALDKISEQFCEQDKRVEVNEKVRINQ